MKLENIHEVFIIKDSVSKDINGKNVLHTETFTANVISAVEYEGYIGINLDRKCDGCTYYAIYEDYIKDEDDTHILATFVYGSNVESLIRKTFRFK